MQISRERITRMRRWNPRTRRVRDSVWPRSETLVFAAVFAGLYEVVDVDLGDHSTWFSSFYYSVVTLTTLGYGDVTPASTAAQIVALIEVVIGYVMLGGLICLLSNKLARRGE